ncbi:MAG: transposase [Gammaproteobacteria bacterium]|nr:transposase [Gammaproteobacteria bacterium]
MARLPRLNLPGIPQHVIQRGNNQQVSFFKDKDYAVYLDKLKLYSKKYSVAVHSYVLMTNHVHLLMTPETEQGVSQMMQSLGRYYVRYINQTYERTGTLWEGRYKSTLVDSDNYFLTVSRYIELNPVRAGMVAHPAEYPWSSYQCNALGKPIELITPHFLYEGLAKTGKTRQKRYTALCDKMIADYTLEEIRHSINRAWVLGDERFKKQIEKQTGRRASPLARGGDRRSEEYQAKS